MMVRREDRKVQELGNCPFEDTADDCTELNQRIKRGEDAEKRGVSLVFFKFVFGK